MTSLASKLHLPEEVVRARFTIMRGRETAAACVGLTHMTRELAQICASGDVNQVSQRLEEWLSQFEAIQEQLSACSGQCQSDLHSINAALAPLLAVMQSLEISLHGANEGASDNANWLQDDSLQGGLQELLMATAKELENAAAGSRGQASIDWFNTRSARVRERLDALRPVDPSFVRNAYAQIDACPDEQQLQDRLLNSLKTQVARQRRENGVVVILGLAQVVGNSGYASHEKACHAILSDTSKRGEARFVRSLRSVIAKLRRQRPGIAYAVDDVCGEVTLDSGRNDHGCLLYRSSKFRSSKATKAFMSRCEKATEQAVVRLAADLNVEVTALVMWGRIGPHDLALPTSGALVGPPVVLAEHVSARRIRHVSRYGNVDQWVEELGELV